VSITVEEKFDSRNVTSGENATAELRFVIRGTTSDIEARVALEDATPIFYNLYDDGSALLPRQSISVEPVGNDIWEGVVRSGVSGGLVTTDDFSFSFDTGGGSQHITQSLATIGSFSASGTPPAFGGAIGVTDNNVEGVDITVPVYTFSETYTFEDSLITPSYKMTLFNLTGKVNGYAWKGFAVGEALFLGASGTKRGFDAWEITYRFAGSPNRTGITVGTITGISKKGWEYLWIRYADKEDTTAKALVKQPLAAYVEQVYEYVDFSLLGIGV